jgi:hypothetical protein
VNNVVVGYNVKLDDELDVMLNDLHTFGRRQSWLKGLWGKIISMTQYFHHPPGIEPGTHGFVNFSLNHLRHLDCEFFSKHES